MNKDIDELMDRHIPQHNEIGDDESHYHCEECAEIVRARVREALAEAYRWWKR